MQRKTKWCLAGGCSGAALILLGGLLGWVAFPAVVDDQVAETVAIKNGTDAWDRWIELPLPMNFKLYIFNITNPVEITKGDKPSFVEIGPYVWKETRAKEKIEYHEAEDRASYNQRLLFEFDAENSNGTEEDLIMVPNIPVIAFAQITESIAPLASSISAFGQAVEQMFTEQYENTVFTKVSVHDYIFGGLPMKCDHNETLSNLNAILMCAAYSLVAPKTVTIGGEEGGFINHFSFFKYKNDSYDGRYEVSLGLNNVEEIGQIRLWENKTMDDKWGDDKCNTIKGTDSTVFRPDLDEVNELYIYNTDICRSVKLTYKEETEYEGIAGRRYVTTKDLFASVENNKDNYCYCPQSVSGLTSRGGCLKDGLLELSSCQGAPVVLSHPHFLFGDEQFQNSYPELEATEQDHQIYLDLEPYTGTPLRGASRIQMNMYLKQIPDVPMMKDFAGYVLPVLWMEEGVELNQELLDMLHEQLLDILDILDIIRWLLIGVGIALLCISAVYYYFAIRK